VHPLTLASKRLRGRWLRFEPCRLAQSPS